MVGDLIPWLILALCVAAVAANLFRTRPVTREMVSGRVSILIPARNEELTLPGCLLSAVFTGAAEIIVYNDSSTDGTAHVVSSSSARYNKIRLIEGVPLPEGWTGKAHACEQLGEAAESEWLLFLDAGSRLSSMSVERLLAEAERRKLTLLCCTPEVEAPTFAQSLILPALDFTISAFSPLLPSRSSCMLVHKATWELVGGHKAVAGEVGSDQALARLWRLRGERFGDFDGNGLVKESRSADFGMLWSSFRRHLYLAFPETTSFLVALVLTAVFQVGLCWLVPWWIWQGALIALRIAHGVRLRQPLWSALLQPLAALYLLAAAVASFSAAHSRNGVEWKGRRYRPN